MPRAGFKPTIPATKRPQTYALDRAVTGIGITNYKLRIYFKKYLVFYLYMEVIDLDSQSVTSL
jgi:hypothetical protein